MIRRINAGKLERRTLQYPDSKIPANAGFTPFLEIIDVYPDALPVIEFKSEVMMVYVAITRAKHSVELSSTSSTPDWWTKELDACRRPVELLGE